MRTLEFGKIKKKSSAREIERVQKIDREKMLTYLNAKVYLYI